MKFFCALLAFLVTLHSARADDLSSTNLCHDASDNFTKGAHEMSVGAGVFFSPIGSPNREAINYAGPLVRYGYMLNTPNPDAAWRGNFEVLGELFGAGIFEGTGNYVANATFWVRYNIIPPQSKVVPYLQLGAGVTLTDIDRKILGQAFNFNLNAAAGLRYFLQPDISLNAEYRYQHISNAGMSENNLGVNAHGPALSVSWYF